jgi:hypothetical protein
VQRHKPKYAETGKIDQNMECIETNGRAEIRGALRDWRLQKDQPIRPSEADLWGTWDTCVQYRMGTQRIVVNPSCKNKWAKDADLNGLG